MKLLKNFLYKISGINTIPSKYHYSLKKELITKSTKRLKTMSFVLCAVLPILNIFSSKYFKWDLNNDPLAHELILQSHLARLGILIICICFLILTSFKKIKNNLSILKYLNFAMSVVGYTGFAYISAQNVIVTGVFSRFIVIILISSVYLIISNGQRIFLYLLSVTIFGLTLILHGFAISHSSSDLINISILFLFSYILSYLMHKSQVKDFVNHKMIVDQRDQLEKLSFEDSLTGLKNRRFFNEIYTRETSRAMREKTEIAVIIFDLDNFKKINDTYGHLNGDICLQETAKALSQAIRRTTDMIARFGGEEFIAVLPDTNKIGMEIVAKRAVEAVAALNIQLSHQNISITISAGASICMNMDKDSPDPLLNLADKLLYKAKANGKNNYCAGILK